MRHNHHIRWLRLLNAYDAFGICPLEPISERDRPCAVRGGREFVAVQGRAGTTELVVLYRTEQGGNQAVVAEDNEYSQEYLQDLVTTSSKRQQGEKQ